MKIGFKIARKFPSTGFYLGIIFLDSLVLSITNSLYGFSLNFLGVEISIYSESKRKEFIEKTNNLINSIKNKG